MKNQQDALSELFSGLVKRYGDDQETMALIKQQINLINNKSKISITDLDNIENSIKSRRSSKMSDYSPASLRVPSKTPQFTKAAGNSDKFITTEIAKQMRLTSLRPMKKMVSRLPDNQIFPSESSVTAKESDRLWRFYSSISPANYKYSHLDIWSKIHEADYIKYKNELKLKQKQKKLQQIEYKNFLSKQIIESKKKNELSEGSLVSIEDVNKNKTVRKLCSTNKEIKEMIKIKQERLLHDQKEKAREEARLIEKWNQENTLEKNRLLNKRKQKIDLSFEHLNDAQRKKASMFNNIIESRRKSIELLKERVDSIEKNEFKKKLFILEKIAHTHDDERLKQLMPQNTKKEHFFTGQTSLQFKEDPFYSKTQINEHYKLLKQQIHEKHEAELKKKIIALEEGEAIKELDRSAKIEQKSKRAKKALQQKKMHEELDTQIMQRYNKQISDCLFTDAEAKINKKIFESSLSILESSA